MRILKWEVEFRPPKWLIVTAFFVMLVGAFSLDWAFAQRPWELPRWQRTTSQVDLLEVKAKDWADMSIDQKHWYVRGYVSATWYWWYWLRVEGVDAVQAEQNQFFPVNEVQLVEMMDWLVWDPSVREQALMQVLVQQFVAIRQNGGAPMKR